MKLDRDIYDVYGEKICSKGAVINRQLMRKLREKGAQLPRKHISVNRTPLLKDFTRALKDERYRELFSSPGLRKRIVAHFAKLKLTRPLLLEIEQMKAELPETYHHVLMMAGLVIKMILDVGTSRYDPVLAASLCLTHDLGKTRISKKVLNKKGPLTEEQYQLIKMHPLIGFILLNYYVGWEGRQYCETAFEHHEKLDGSGYPRGIRKVDRYSQLIAPVDIYDALISRRPYRRMSYNGRLAIDILLEDARSNKLNLKNVYLLINCMRKQKSASLAGFRVSQKRRAAPPAGNCYGRIKREKARRLLRKD